MRVAARFLMAPVLARALVRRFLGGRWCAGSCVVLTDRLASNPGACIGWSPAAVSSLQRRQLPSETPGIVALLCPRRQHHVLVRTDRAMAVAVAGLVAVPERHALRR